MLNVYKTNSPKSTVITKVKVNFVKGISCTLLLFMFLIAMNKADAQQYTYGTGSVASNTAPFAAGNGSVTVSGNDVTVTASTTITAGTYNFHNLTINSGVTLTVTGNAAPLIIECTGTFTNNGLLSAAGGAGGVGITNVAGASGGAGGTAVAWGKNGGSGGNAVSNGGGLAHGNPGVSYGTTAPNGGTGQNGLSNYVAGGGGSSGYSIAGNAGKNGNAAGGAAGNAYGNSTFSINVSGSIPSVPANGPATTIYLMGGSGGGGGGGVDYNNGGFEAQTEHSGGGGGAGGGCIQITATTIAIGSQNPAITVQGGNGGNAGPISANYIAGGGGAGSGGSINLQYFNYTNSLGSDANLIIAGGTGGTSKSATSGAGAAGVPGYLFKQSDIFLCTQPTIQASAFSTSVASSTSLLVTLTRGNGNGGVIVIARATSTSQSVPSSNTSYGSTNSATNGGSATFNGGQSTTGTGNFIVYQSNSPSSGTISFTVTGLTAGTSYSFDAYEENSTGPCYMVPGITTINTPSACTPPSTQASGITASSITNTSMVVSWTAGSGDQTLLVGHIGSAVVNDPVSGTPYTPPANPNTSFTGTVLSGTDCVLYVGSGTSTTLQNLTPGTTYNFKVYSLNSGTSCYNIAIPASNTGSATALNPMTYTSSTVTQVTGNVLAGATGQAIIQVQVVTGGGTTPAITLNSLTFSLNGSSLATDISNAKIYYTGTSNTFATSTQFGTTQTSPALATPYTITPGSGTSLALGTNYFWIAYDVAAAPPCVMFDFLDADATSINITAYAGTSNQTPSTTSPAGNRQITYCNYASFTAPASTTHITNVNLVGNTTTLSVSPTAPTVAPYYTITTSPVADVTLSSSYTLKVTTGTSTRRNNFSAWIDWNQNGVFGDNANEFIGGTAGAAATQTSYTFTVPGTALAGNTAMRIVYDNSATTTGFVSSGAGTPSSNVPCGAYTATAGETRDYVISVVAAPCSGTPTPGTATAVTNSLCPNGTSVINLTGQTTGVSGITYQWQSSLNGGSFSNVSGGSGANTPSYTTGTLANATTSDATYSYKCVVTCTNGGGNAASAATSPVVTVHPTPAISISPSSTSICNGTTSGNLTASNAASGTTAYSWSPTTNLSNAAIANPTANPSTTTSYTVTGTANGCSNTASITVSVNPTIITFTPSSSNSIGIGSSIALTASATSTNGGVTYAWLPNDGTLTAQTGATVTATPLVTESYTVTATDGSGCTRSGVVVVNVLSGTTGNVNCGYTFSAGNESGAWVDISGATTLGTTVAANYSIDLSSLTPAFNFDFNGITYNKFGVNGQGWVYFGTNTPSASITAPISSSLTVDGVIAVMASAQLSAMTVEYVVTGTSPNRQLTIEWSCSWNGSHAPFQLILNEHGGSTYSFPFGGGGTQASDGITFNYFNESSEVTHGGTNIEIGLRGASDADFNNRQQSSGKVNSSSTSAGVAASSVVTVGGSAWFGGASFTTTPQIEFLYVPAIATPTISPNTTQNVCTGASTTLTGTSTNPVSPTTWLWQIGGTGAPGTNNASTYSAVPATAGNYFYTVKITNSTGCSRTSYAEALVAASCCTPPTTDATNFSSSAFNAGSGLATISFKRGNGNGGVIVVARDGAAPVTGIPASGTIYSNANAAYGTGGAALGDAFIVYANTTPGNGSTVINVPLTALTSGHSYYFEVYEYSTSSTACYSVTPLAGGFCIGAPLAITVTPASPISFCAGSTTTLGLSGLSPGTFYTYQWQNSATTGGAYSNSSGTSTASTYLTPGTLPSSPVYYVAQVTCPNDGSSTQSSEENVSNTPFYADCYCAGFFDFTATNIGVKNVHLVGNTTTLNYTASVVPNGNLYNDWGYQGSPNPDISVTSSYTATVTVGSFVGSNAVDVWIDWDHDGIYQTSDGLGLNELVAAEVTGVAANGTATFNFTVPATAVSGLTGMRVRAAVGTTGMNTNTNVCNNYNNNTIAGETEDFAVNIAAAPCSGTPTAGTAVPVSGSLCPGGSTQINISGATSGVSGLSYQWGTCTNSGGAGFSPISGANSSFYNPGALANATLADVSYFYAVQITCANGGGNATSAAATITVHPTPSVSNSPSAPTICNGSNVGLNASNLASGTTTYSWSPSSGLSSSTIHNPTATPSGTKTYTVTETANGCSSTGTVVVTTNPGIISVTPPAPSIAIGGGTSLTASASSTNGGVTYAWLPNDGTLTAQTGATVVASPLSAETYTVTATDASSCSIAGTVVVNVTAGTPGHVSCGYSFGLTQVAPQSGSIFSPTCQPFPTLSGGTTLATNSGMTNSLYSIDVSGLSPAFNFDFNGITYNKFGVSTNGFVYLGNTAPSASTTQPISSTAACDGIISAYGAALSPLSGNGSLSYKVSGTSPNRTLTIEWDNMGLADANLAVNILSFQVILNEHGGSSYSFPLAGEGTQVSDGINFLYSDQYCIAVGGNANDNVQIGLRGAANTDFNDLTGNGGSGFGWPINTNTSASDVSAGSANTSGITWKGGGTASYVEGTPELSYTPTIATPTITPAGTQTICLGGAGVTLTGHSTIPASPTTWQWVNFSTSTNVSGATNSTYLANPSPAGNYYFAIAITNATGCSRTSAAEAVVVQNCAPIAYNVTGNDVIGGSNCGNIDVKLVNSQLLVNYQLFLNGTTPVGSAVAGTGAALDFGTKVTAGIYTIIGTDANSRTTQMLSSATVFALPTPTASTGSGAGGLGIYCPYESVSLTSSPNGLTSYVWSNGQTTQNQSFGAGGHAGSYTVIVTDANNCTASASTSVTVNTPATVTVSPASATICAQDNIALTASGAVSYTWSPSPDLSVLVGANIIAGPATAGTYTYTAIGTDENSCTSSGTTVITAKPLPVVTISPTNAVCTGLTSVTLTASGDAVSYTWNPSTFLNTSTGSVVISQISLLSLYDAIGTGANGCTAHGNIVPVATFPVGGTVTPATSVICSGGTKTLSSVGAAGNNYQWQISTDNVTWTDITGATGGTYITHAGDGTTKKYYRQMANSNRCFNIASTTAIVDISVTPIVTFTSVTSTSATVTWSPYGSGQYSLVWSGTAGSGSASAVTTNNFVINGLTPNGDLLVTVTQTSPSTCAGVTLTSGASTHTLCSTPVMTNVVATTFHGFTASWTTVNGATVYRLFYRDLYTQSSWSFIDVTGTSVTIPVPYGGHTYAVYVAAKNCPSAGNIGDGSTPIRYVTTNPGSNCTPSPTVATSSSCPNQLHVDISGTTPPFNLVLRRISPGLTAGVSYSINTASVDVTVGTQYAGSTWEIFATKNCGGGVSSTISNISIVTVKPGCPIVNNLVLSHPTCYGFTASWNTNDCSGLGISGYQLLIKKNGSPYFNGYPVGTGNYAIIGWLNPGLSYDVVVMAVACNGATSGYSLADTIATGGCGRIGDDEQAAATPQSISGNDKEAVTVYPNPAEGQFWVNLGSTTNSEAIVKIELVNQLGQVVLTNISQMTNGMMNQLVKTPEGLATGIYFVRTSVEGNVYVNRLMISKE